MTKSQRNKTHQKLKTGPLSKTLTVIPQRRRTWLFPLTKFKLQVLILCLLDMRLLTDLHWRYLCRWSHSRSWTEVNLNVDIFSNKQETRNNNLPISNLLQASKRIWSHQSIQTSTPSRQHSEELPLTQTHWPAGTTATVVYFTFKHRVSCQMTMCPCSFHYLAALCRASTSYCPKLIKPHLMWWAPRPRPIASSSPWLHLLIPEVTLQIRSSLHSTSQSTTQPDEFSSELTWIFVMDILPKLFKGFT